MLNFRRSFILRKKVYFCCSPETKTPEWLRVFVLNFSLIYRLIHIVWFLSSALRWPSRAKSCLISLYHFAFIYLIFFCSIYFLKKILIRKKRSFSIKRYGPLVSFLNLRPKLTLETLEQGGKYVQNVSIVNFEQVNVGWS